MDAKPAPYEGKKNGSKASHSTHGFGATGDAFPIRPSHEMAGTGAVVRRVKQQAVRADGMVPVMLDDSRLADQPCNDKWKKSRIRQMNDVSRPNIGQEGREPRSTDYLKRQSRVVGATDRCFRN
jgi:hypothetical protein